nr:YebC/PmpR family DNA-binding transcriptional regulator [Candidatus Kuenenia stuttgartiensis]
MMDALTDNKNRTVPRTKKTIEKFGGNMGETGCVSWMFEKKGIILVNNNVCVEDEFMMLVLDAGAEDLQTVREYYQVLCAQTDLDAVKKAIGNSNITIENAETSWLANIL